MTYSTQTDYDLWTEERNARFESFGHEYGDSHHQPSTYQPTKQLDPAQLEEAVAEQVKTFGQAKYANCIGSSSTGYKVAKKKAALERTLTAAFAPREACQSDTLYLGDEILDTQCAEDIDPIDILIEQDWTAELLQERVATFLHSLTTQQRTALELTAEGKTWREVAEILGCSHKNVGKLLGKARKAASLLSF